jgi:pimeloyl-ACP methyl ester carboxylesterase
MGSRVPYHLAVNRITRTRAIVLLVLALIASALLWRAWFISRPPLVPIGGHRLEARLKGMGYPPVVFEGGFEDPMRLFEGLQDSITEHTETLVYDRAGYGRSDAGPQPRTALAAASDLRALLAVLGVRPPVVVVCYSAGCLFARVFAHEYPAEVAGLVFIDPATEATYAGTLSRPPEKDWPPGARREWAALSATLDQARAAWPLPSVPCLLVTAMKPSGRWPLETRNDMNDWLKEQQNLLGKLGGATHILFPQADHASVLAEKDVTKAILELVGRIKVQS